MKLQFKRSWGLVLGLLATLALVFSMEDEDDSGLLPPERPGRARSAAAVLPDPAQPASDSGQHYLDWGLLQGRTVAAGADKVQTDLFRSQRWYVPPPKTAAELASQAPVVPQPGFAYIGKLEDGPQGTMIMLAGANRLYMVGAGENVDRQWRLDREDEHNLYLTYLPLDLPKTLSKKSKPAATANPASHLPVNPDDLQGNL